jgi:hypothetical protein
MNATNAGAAATFMTKGLGLKTKNIAAISQAVGAKKIIQCFLVRKRICSSANKFLSIELIGIFPWGYCPKIIIKIVH